MIETIELLKELAAESGCSLTAVTVDVLKDRDGAVGAVPAKEDLWVLTRQSGGSIERFCQRLKLLSTYCTVLSMNNMRRAYFELRGVGRSRTVTVVYSTNAAALIQVG